MLDVVAPPEDHVLLARNLTYAYDGSPALVGVSVEAREGEILAVTGPRASGKTTLLKCLSGRLVPDHGEVWFQGASMQDFPAGDRERLRRDHFSWIGTEPELVPELTAWENAALPLMLRGVSRREAKSAAVEWLGRLNIGGCAKERPATLMQSQRQRVAVARALAAGPTVLFADEPTAPLHRTDCAQVARTLTTAARSHGITVVLTTHSGEVMALADRTVALTDGRLEGTAHAPGNAREDAEGPAEGTEDGAAEDGAEGRAACSVSV